MNAPTAPGRSRRAAPLLRGPFARLWAVILLVSFAFHLVTASLPFYAARLGADEAVIGLLIGLIAGDRFEAKAREAGLDPIPGLSLEARFDPAALARDVRRLRALVRAEGVDVIHCHHSHDHWLAMLVRGAGRERPAAVARTFHNFRAVKRGRPAAWIYQRTTAAFAVSRQIEARCREVGFPPERVHWVPGAADLARFSAGADPQPVREEFKLGTAPVVASVARLAPNRGHELLLAGFRLLLRRLPEARLLLVGKGETRSRLEALVAELGLADRVIFTGYRDRDLPAVLAAADCFALMAAGSDESCRAVLEAMAAARPVVARRVGALPETVRHGETGLLVDDDRPESVAAALLDILADPELADLRPGPDTAEKARALVRINLKHGVGVIKTRGTERAGLPDTDPRQQSYTEDVLRAIVEEASARNVPVEAHAHGAAQRTSPPASASAAQASGKWSSIGSASRVSVTSGGHEGPPRDATLVPTRHPHRDADRSDPNLKSADGTIRARADMRPCCVVACAGKERKMLDKCGQPHLQSATSGPRCERVDDANQCGAVWVW
ncbi:MAG: glycosyltransferase [Firmicutes bacterium]|nr:glycosyltransferase [Bacillota bacterium]